MFEPIELVTLANDSQPQILVVVDTEEEFDWFADPDPEAISVSAIREIGRIQEIFDEYKVTPCYVIDYPIASSADGIAALKPIVDSQRCELGSHLHPWVNPPKASTVSVSDMYPGNLPEAEERKKLGVLTERIQKSFGLRPTTYKAGRYGVGPNTSRILEDLGYQIDVSYCPAFNYAEDGGPDFSAISPKPFWFGRGGQMLEVPLSGAFTGIAGRAAPGLYEAAGRFPSLRGRGILSRLGIVDRLMLSPEGYSFEEHKRLVRWLLARGIRVFTWNLHSPTVVPGMTMYTSNEQEVKLFLDKFRRFFDFFFNELGGIATTPGELRRQLELLR